MRRARLRAGGRRRPPTNNSELSGSGYRTKRRYDRHGGTGTWELLARQRYRYDAANVRTLKQSLRTPDGSDSGTAADDLERVTLYVYPGDFERRGLTRDVGNTEYDADNAVLLTETQYLIGGARIVWQTNTAIGALDRTQRATYTITDLLGSTATVIDLETADILSTGTFYPNGAQENLWVQDAESMAHEPLGFTGKEGDAEVGLTYFGERYLVARGGRWLSPDPLHVHEMEGGELGNSYHYVAGNLLQARDSLGLTLFVERGASAADIERVRVGLQRLTTDVVEINPETGEVTVRAPDAVTSAGGRRPPQPGPGTRLLRRVVANQHRVLIAPRTAEQRARTAFYARNEDNATRRNRKEPGPVGSGGTVAWVPRVHARSGRDVLYTRGRTGEVSVEGSTDIDHFGLAEELIHADRAQRGVRVPNEPKRRGEVAFETNYGAVHQERDSVEEFETTGLTYVDAGGEARTPPAVGPDGVPNITQNDIRADLGAPLRVNRGSAETDRAHRDATHDERD